MATEQIAVRLPIDQLHVLDDLVDRGVYPSRAAAVRGGIEALVELDRRRRDDRFAAGIHRRGAVVTEPRRGEIWWGETEDVGRRPFLVMTRTAVIPVLNSVLAAPVTRTIRDIPTELRLGASDGMPMECVASFDNVRVVAKAYLVAFRPAAGEPRLECVAAVGEYDYQPYLGGAFRWRLGLRPLDDAAWIEVDGEYADDLARKARVLADHPTTVLSWLPDVEGEAGEVLDVLLDHLAERDLVRVDGDRVTNRVTGDVHDRGGLHPLDLAGRLVQEDLILMVRRDQRLVFGGGSVCFPNRWDLASKVGHTMAEVHAPVARLNEQLSDPIDGFFERLRPERGYWRLGWGVLDTDERYQPTDGTAPAPDPLPLPGDPVVGERLFLRVERETLRAFPRTGCILFTIRTHLRPLSHLATRPDDRARLAEAIAAMPDDVATYKQLTDLRPLALDWLTTPSAEIT